MLRCLPSSYWSSSSSEVSAFALPFELLDATAFMESTNALVLSQRKTRLTLFAGLRVPFATCFSCAALLPAALFLAPAAISFVSSD